MAVHKDKDVDIEIDPDPNLRQGEDQHSDVPPASLSNTNDFDADHPSRLHLIWSVLIFQLKLLADGLRDVVLVPISDAPRPSASLA